MKEHDEKGFSFQHEKGPGPHDYKVTWNTGRKSFTYESENGRGRFDAHSAPPPPRQPQQPRRPLPYSRPPEPRPETRPIRRPAPQTPAGKQVRRRSIVPLGCVAVMWLGRALTGGLDSVGGIIRCALLSAVAFGVLRLFFPDKLVDADKEQTEKKPKKEKRSKQKAARSEKAPDPAPEAKQPESEQKPATGTGTELDEVLRQGEESIAEIRRLNDEIPDFKISAQLKQLELLTERIFDFVKQHPEDVRQIRQFLNFYLPTTIKLLRQYVVLQNQGLRMGNIDEGMQKVEDMLDKVIVAFQKQLDSLFESDVVDITADIQVMEQMMAAEGLVAERLEADRE